MRDLTPRDRVLLALSHRETNRVPVDFLAVPETLDRFRALLRIDDAEAVLQHLGIDLRHRRH